MSSKRHRGESTSLNKADSQLCLTCNKSVSDDALECMWCESLQHRSCAKISDIVLSDLPSNIVLFCMHCFQKLPSAIKAHNNVLEMFSLVEKRLETIETSLVNKLSDMQYAQSSNQNSRN